MTPWINYHWPWTSRLRNGLAVLEQIERFLQASAVDPTPASAELAIHEDLGPAFAAATRERASTSENVQRALAELGYQPGPLACEGNTRLGDGVHRLRASGSTGYLLAWTWARRRPFDLAPFRDFYRDHQLAPAVASAPERKAVGLMVSYWFDVKRPGQTAAMFPGAPFQSSVEVWVESRRVNLSLRYASAEFTPELAAAHAEIIEPLGAGSRRGVLQRIYPSKPGGRERRQRIG